MEKNTLKKKNLTLKVDENINLKTLFMDEISEVYVSWLNDYEVTKFTEQKHCQSTLETVKDYVNQLYFSENDLLFGIYYDELHIGNMRLGPINFEHLNAEVGYLIGEKNFWAKGITSKCLKTLVHFAIEDLGLKKINSGYYENNYGSAKVLKKCGFVIEGVKQSNLIFEKERINTIVVGYVSEKKMGL